MYKIFTQPLFIPNQFCTVISFINEYVQNGT